MKVTDITVRLLRIDPRPRYKDGVIPPGRPSVWLYPLITIETDEGIHGYSTAYGPHGDGRAQGEILRNVYLPELRDQDPLATERIWQKLWRKQRHLYNQRDTLLGCIDVALWDIKGKAAGLSIAQLLGTFRDSMPAYASARSEMYTPEEFSAEAQMVKSQGFHGYKLQVRAGPREDIPRLQAVREAVGADFPLMHDPNASYSLTDALRVGKVLDELGYHWFEEPLPDQNHDALRQLAGKVNTPLVVGETVRLPELATYLASGTGAILRGDTLMKGGVTGLRKAMAAAEMFGLHLEIHTANTPLMDVANLHVACASANTEFVENHHPIFRFGLKAHPLDVGADGLAKLPHGPGLGVELDWDWIENHTEGMITE